MILNPYSNLIGSGGVQAPAEGQFPNWIDSLYLNLATAAVWLMPSMLWKACDKFMNAYVILRCDYFSGAGTLTVAVQSAPVMSMTDAAWTTVGTATVSTTGIQVIKLLKTTSTPITGLLRVKVTCNTSAVVATLRADLLLKEQVPSKSMEWLKSTYLNFTGAGSLIMPADFWASMEGFLNLWLLVDFMLVSGTASNLSVNLQTGPAYSMDANAWLDVGTPLTMSTTPQLYDARSTVTNAPEGIIRLQYSAAGAVAGTLRVQALYKDK